MSTASLGDLYPPGPAAAPPDLTAATHTYKQRAWLAMAGLTLFMLLYLALSGWFAWTAYRLVLGLVAGKFSFEGLLVGFGASFLALFMLKALVFVKHGWDVEDIEITREQEPRLFAFIDRLADEAGAPRAHRVFLSPRVNAAVFYDLSLLNLVLPSQKNLEIGLGLVNVLTLSQLKAVLAHEFGHFAQRSMAVGRWVYVAQQIAAHVIGQRDMLDRFLQQLSRVDPRIAWIGWLLSLTVWSIRSLVEIVFRGVVLAQRALSRQMEFQADLVSVSLTGSDELVHALHGLNAADEAWDRTLQFAGSEAGAGRAIGDLFAVQARIIERVREILAEDDYGVAPPLPAHGRESHRVFEAELAQPPRMWASHPPNTEREQNAKRVYVEAPPDARSAWSLFENPQGLREQLSAHVLRSVELPPAPPMPETLARLDAFYARASLDRAYRGMYLGRPIARHARSAAELIGAPLEAQAALAALDALYPESLTAQVERLTELNVEKHSLEALRTQAAVAPGGIIRHRGRELPRSALPAAIQRVTQEIAALESSLQSHDAHCRSVHLACAERVGRGWPAYLWGLLSVLHYAEHREADLEDAREQLVNMVEVVTADRHVSRAERTRLLGAAQETYRVLAEIHAQAASVSLDPALLEELGEPSFAASLGELDLPAPDAERLGEWLDVIDSWVDSALGALASLRAALDRLLASERYVAAIARGQAPPEDAPPAPGVSLTYAPFLPGQERPRASLRWWDRFQTADGTPATLARLASAAVIVGVVVGFGAGVGDAQVTVYNGLGRDVVVEVDGERIEVGSLAHVSARIPAHGTLHLLAATREGAAIEAFDVELQGSYGRYVYSVAGAAPLFQWTAVYGDAEVPPQQSLGAVRWSSTSADHVFEPPPEEVRSTGVARREVLASAAELRPSSQLRGVRSPEERQQLVTAHARWDSADSRHILEWMALANEEPDFAEIVAARLGETPDETLLLRMEQDAAGPQRDAVCIRHRAAAQRTPADASWRYLAIRCMPEGPGQDEAFLAAHRELPENGWLAMAAGYVWERQGDYRAAENAFDQARRDVPPLRVQLADETARLRRLSTPDGPVRLDDLMEAADDDLRTFVAIETGAEVERVELEPYRLLARGEVEQAAAEARKLGAEGRTLLLLAAASDGASPELASDPELLAVREGDGVIELLAGYALAARAGRDTSAHGSGLIDQLGTQGARVVEFLGAARSGSRRPEPPSGVDVQLRSLALGSAVVLLGERAPADWRRDAKRGAWVGERPYFR